MCALTQYNKYNKGDENVQVAHNVSQICPGLPVVLGGVLEQLSQLQGIFTDLLDRGEQETSDGNVNHLLEEPAGLKKVLISPHLHQALQLATGSWMGVTVLGVDREALPLWKKKQCEREI